MTAQWGKVTDDVGAQLVGSALGRLRLLTGCSSRG